ncbi:MAG: MogA/MoaB family molybdenum cofactor biosynthesis protein [Candidatus Krumholzibacteria bacterium]|jgi:molybdopterin adenylyltransferase|nr:MogA/MoaB family molybdenum cofactor biosynthesis protein [Candidatus Krumholzibacteria bacterium]
MKVLVLTISDRASRGEYEDLSGPALEKIIADGIPGASVSRAIVPDEAEAILSSFGDNPDKDVILTTGGTGLGPRDVTPEATARFCDREIPGIAEYLRAESLRETVNAAVSRGRAGMKGKTIIINLPGSVRGASFCAKLLVPLLPHACAMAGGGGH